MTRLNAQRQRPGFLACHFGQYGRLKLVSEELIRIALIDKRRDGVPRLARLHQCATVPLLPCIRILTQIV
ncbi:hypothetical protein D3C78_853250 [compost metagenome]